MALPFAELSFPEIYEQALVGPLFRPWAELILEDVELGTSDRVLDIACGTGKEMGDEERGRIIAAIVRDSAEAMRPQTNEMGFAFDLSTNVATARS